MKNINCLWDTLRDNRTKSLQIFHENWPNSHKTILTICTRSIGEVNGLVRLWKSSLSNYKIIFFKFVNKHGGFADFTRWFYIDDNENDIWYQLNEWWFTYSFFVVFYMFSINKKPIYKNFNINRKYICWNIHLNMTRYLWVIGKLTWITNKIFIIIIIICYSYNLKPISVLKWDHSFSN